MADREHECNQRPLLVAGVGGFSAFDFGWGDAMTSLMAAELSRVHPKGCNEPIPYPEVRLGDIFVTKLPTKPLRLYTA